jgi:hypothetical protein
VNILDGLIDKVSVLYLDEMCIESITPRYQKKNYGKKTASHDSDDADFK